MNVHHRHQSLTEDQFNLLSTIHQEYKVGMTALNSLGPYTFTVYGGHRVEEGDPSYVKVMNLCQKLASRGWGIVSGGGPGIMKAALEGAKAGNGKAIAFCINIENEPMGIDDPDVVLTFTQFSVRKYMLRQSDAFLFAPGGFGTLDELMELLTLIKTRKYPMKPIFLLDTDFWQGYLTWFNEILYNERKVVSADFLSVCRVVDDEDCVIKFMYEE